MKKALLIAFMTAAFSQAKAQQVFRFKPADSLNNNLLQKYFNPNPYAQPQLFQPLIAPNQLLAAVNSQVKINTYDHMPIADFVDFSKMPVVKLDGTDKMPIFKLGSEATVIVDTKKQTP